ncbi:unnamed protein product [marine sediment metagenome]|uniref:HNH domain-containing protein n=1 Tax=marine sediment metagenome TaxID=412755 RepID=X1JBK6_9ZZZZ
MGAFTVNAEWAKRVKRWRKRHGVTALVGPARPDRCTKCIRKKKILTRHHKGNEYLLARMRPDLWSKRYVNFYKADIIWLCPKCHEAIHERFVPKQRELNRKWYTKASQGRKVHKKTLERYHGIFQTITEKWLG